MDREVLRRRAASRRSGAEVEVPRKAVWKCGFCSRDFVHERAFENHSCPAKRKIDELRSPVGQLAYALYCAYNTMKRHSVQTIEAFGESRNYSPFLKIAAWVKRARLPNPEAFMKLMVEHRVEPALWARDGMFSMYLQAFDAAVDPETQFFKALEELETIAAETKVPLSQVFEHMSTDELLTLVEKRKLTHWFLLASPKFKSNLLARPQAERELIGAVLQVGAALQRMKQEPGLVRQFVEAVKELGL